MRLFINRNIVTLLISLNKSYLLQRYTLSEDVVRNDYPLQIRSNLKYNIVT